jgi:hypothetical protein
VANTQRPTRSRIVVAAGSRKYQRPTRRPQQRNAELWVAISVIIAAALATFVALFLTSRPYDPMNATVAPEQIVPQGPSFTPSPKPSPTLTTTPQNHPANESSPAVTGGEIPAVTDDATIQTHIDSTLASDPVMSKLDVSTLVEGGKVTIVGSVRSVTLKQQVEKAIRSIKGVTAVDNQLVITEATPS